MIKEIEVGMIGLGSIGKIQIKNSTKHIEVKVVSNKTVKTVEELVDMAIKKYDHPFGMKYKGYNSVEYKQYLRQKIKDKENEIEDLKFYKRICGRKIKEVENFEEE